MTQHILLERRLRQIERPFGWIPLRLLRDGYWAALSSEAKILYCVLCIISDRHGVSYYGHARLQHSTGIDPASLQRAHDELVQRDLIAVDAASHTVQLLSLPAVRKELPQGCADTRHQAPPQARAMPSDAPPSLSSQQQLQAVRQLIRQLSTDKRGATSRSQTDAAQK